MRFKHVYCGVGFGVIFFSSVFASGYPKIDTKKITFENGQIIPLLQKTVYFKNPEEANEKGLPVELTQSAILLKNSQRVLKVFENHFYEDSDYRFVIYDFNGKQVFPDILWDSEYVVLDKQKKLLLVNIEGSHFVSKNSSHFLVDLNQHKLFELKNNTAAYDFGISGQEEIVYIWTKITTTTPMKWEVRLYDLGTGKEIFSKRVSKAAKLAIHYNKKSYVVLPPTRTL